MNPAGRFVDFGAGYGLFVRLMRDQGYDFYWEDAYCENLFARGFEAKSEASGSTPIFEAVTAFEVFEHLIDPLGTIQSLLSRTPSLIFSTELLPSVVPAPDQWWYYGLDHGQHVAFYSRVCLEKCAARLGCKLLTDGQSFHLFTRDNISQQQFNRINNRCWTFFLRRRKRTSKMMADYELMRGPQS